jgi:hypothetical protein
MAWISNLIINQVYQSESTEPSTIAPAPVAQSTTSVEPGLRPEIRIPHGLDNTKDQGERTTAFEAAPLIKPPALRGVSDWGV